MREKIAESFAGQGWRWQAIAMRNHKLDGTFYYAVKTTGVYCRPSCPSRRGKPGNVSFFVTCEDAEGAGFRPCKRCNPRELALPAQYAAMVAKICHNIEMKQEPPSLGDMARKANLSPSHFHRIFKAVTGLTPRAYAVAQRAARVKSALAEPGTTVTKAIYRAGFNSSGRFYEASNELLGMTPTDYRNGGKSIEIRFTVRECSLGSILVACSGKGVCAILLGDDPDALVSDLRCRFSKAQIVGGDSRFETLVAKVLAFVEAPAAGLELPLDVRGTVFQQRVWQALRQIPAGKTANYSEIAERIGAPKAVRAVAKACAANKIAVAVPCHRVICKNGKLSGYHWGIERKRVLLEREKDK
jgi:AraC family transcriptional regulator, regulatory protein of adaptative response / methylated-DNA-[protein]-cysteine methyltransferase